MIENNKQLWVDLYRPRNLDDYVLNDNIKQYFRQMVQGKSLQNFTVEGCPGSGKTTLARLLANELNAEVLFVKCATEGTLDVLRTKIQEFCNAMSLDGRVKMVVLDEIDSAAATGVNSFQLGLRTLIEAAQDDTRFVLTCNYINKVVPAILSRCPVIPLKYGKRDLFNHVKKILDAEKIRYNRESMQAFIDEAFGFYPDCRRIINYLQLCCNSGELVVRLNRVVNSDRTEFLEELVSKTMNCADLLDVRGYYLKNKDKIPDFVTFSSELFNKAVDDRMLDSDGILKLTDLIYQENVVIDKDVGFFAILTALRKYGKKKDEKEVEIKQ